MTFLVSGVLGTLCFCLDNDNLLFWSREKGGSSEPNELPLDPPLYMHTFFGVLYTRMQMVCMPHLTISNLY